MGARGNVRLAVPDSAYAGIVTHAEEGRQDVVRLLEGIRDTLDALSELGFEADHTLSSVSEFVRVGVKALCR